MTPEELAAEIENLIVGSAETFSASMIRAQNRLYSRIIATLKDLELDSEGYIKQSSANRRILREAQKTFDQLVQDPAYKGAVESQLKIIPRIDALNTTYFTSISKIFSPNRHFIKDLQKQVIRDVNVRLLNEGVVINVREPLNNILSQNINSGGSFAGFNEQVRNFIKGNENIEGRLLRYSKTYVADTLFSYARTWQEAVTTDLDLEFYLYSGGITAAGKGSGGSRSFCRERNGNYYHRKEIELWADLEWKGKNSATTKSSIFTLLGGHNCRHSVIPVSTLIVPKDVIERAVLEGYYKQAA
ncbi:MAG TPA: hypothetical protein VIQ51_14510 [Chryseosolibacter sp.]